MTQQEEQLFAVRWCLARAAEHVEKSNILASPVEHPLDLVVNGVNITRTILDVLDMIDPARTKAAVSGEWIPVTERLPDEGQECLVYSENTDDDFGRFAARWIGGMWQTNGGVRFNLVHLPYWMPLPEPPARAERCGPGLVQQGPMRETY